jgi:hypothetical protein
MIMPPRIARLAGLGAYAACAGFALLYMALVYLTRPTPRGGIDPINAVVTWISLGGVFAALIAVHVLIGGRLLDAARASAGASDRS